MERVLYSTISILGTRPSELLRKGQVKILISDLKSEGKSIVVDGYKGAGATYEQREEALITISFNSSKSWVGTIKDLEKCLSST